MTTTATSTHPLLDAAATAHTALDEVTDRQPVFLSSDDKDTLLAQLDRLGNQVAALRLRLLSAADNEHVADQGHRDAAAWLAARTHTDSRAARAEARLASALDHRWHHLAAAMTTGHVHPEQATVIVAALDALPDRLDPRIVADAERTLVEYADRFPPAQLRRLGRRILDIVAPEIAEAEEARQLDAEERAAHERARLHLRPLGNGLTRISGKIPSLDAERLQTYLDAYTSPRHHDPHTTRDAATAGTAVVGCYGEGDRIPYPRKLAHALGSLLEHLDPDRLPDHGGDATTVIVTLALDSLRADLATADLLTTDNDTDDGAGLTAAQARRLACTARIIPAVLGGDSEILDLGRSRRLFSPAQRKALRLRDRRCRAHGCRVKATWTEAHHLRPWHHCGPTDLDNAISLCPWHHHRIHDPTHTHVVLPDGDLHIHRRT